MGNKEEKAKEKMQEVIGLTGSYCSGKTTVSDIFKESGYEVIEVDKLGHKALEAQQDKVVKHFGAKILKKGVIDRKALGNIVFGDKKELIKLENIVHPLMREYVYEEIKNSKSKKILLSAAILIEMDLAKACDYKILIWAPREAIISRGRERDKVKDAKIERIVKSQLSLKKRLRFVDFTIKNNSNHAELYNITKRLILHLNELKSN